MTPTLALKFWGVRGSIPVPGPATAGYGGNTPCLEVRYDSGPVLIFDAGSGLRHLGLEFAARRPPPGTAIHLFLTHFHWDHLQGIPFFPPLFWKDCRMVFYSTFEPDILRQAIHLQVSRPYFPAGGAIAAAVDYRKVEAGIQIGSLAVRPLTLFHPGGATGFRIDAPEGSIAYASDHEHGDAPTDRALREQAHGANVLIWDSQYTPEEYAARTGWGHSTWMEGVSAARDANAGQLIIFHHDPQRDDAALARIVDQARDLFANTIAAREGDVIRLPTSVSQAVHPVPGYAGTCSP